MDAVNRKLGVSEAQKVAMLHGSMFGFDTPGADPHHHVSDDVPN